MTKQIIYILFIATNINCFSQEVKNERNISLGIYGIGYRQKNNTVVFLGGLLDIPIKNCKSLCSSTSINYYGYYRLTSQFHASSIASGISWKIQKNHVIFRPGFQLGYLNQYAQKPGKYIFHGVFLRSSAELTYQINRFEYGIHFNIGMGFGPTKYHPPYYEKSVQNNFGGMVGLGFQVKYNLSK